MKQPAKKQICAVYCRVANGSQLGLGLERQQDNLYHFAKAQGFDNIMPYIDNGFSGNTGDRPAFAQMNADIEAGKIEAIVAYSADRLWRDYLNGLSWYSRIQSMKIPLLFANGEAPMLETMQELEVAIRDYYHEERSKKKRSSPKATPNLL